jgi:hypothetical protein
MAVPEPGVQSENTRPPSKPMQLVGERRFPDPPQPSLQNLISAATNQTTPPSLPQEYMHRSAWKAGVMGAFNAMATVLAVRLILLVAVIGAIGLSWLALQSPDVMRLGVLGVYCGAVVVPSVWLACVR